MLINDANDPEKYSGVRVTRSGYREMVKSASRAKNKGSKLLNEAWGLLFTKEELANSSGMGLRKDKQKALKPLDPVRVEAALGMLDMSI